MHIHLYTVHFLICYLEMAEQSHELFTYFNGYATKGVKIVKPACAKHRFNKNSYPDLNLLHPAPFNKMQYCKESVFPLHRHVIPCSARQLLSDQFLSSKNENALSKH